MRYTKLSGPDIQPRKNLLFLTIDAQRWIELPNAFGRKKAQRAQRWGRIPVAPSCCAEVDEGGSWRRLILTGRFNFFTRRSKAKTAQRSTGLGAAQFAQVVLVAERVLLRNQGVPGGQDFFNDTAVGIGAKLLVA